MEDLFKNKPTFMGYYGEYICFKGLDPKKKYLVEQMNLVIPGDVLMNVGIPIKDCFVDFKSIIFDLKAV